MISRISIIVLSLLISCKAQTESKSIIGNYLSKKYNSFERGIMLLKNENYELHGELNINIDSTYLRKSCGNDIYGHWRIEGDSLVLFCEKNLHFKRGNTEPENWSCGTAPEKFFIEKSGVLTQYIDDKNGRLHTCFEKKKLN